MPARADDTNVLDVAIVGGGISGVYSGWRLLTSAQTSGQKVELFEASNRIGGRLLSVVPPGIPETRIELGGMRYNPNVHTRVARLIEHLGLETDPFPVSEPQNILHVRGRVLRNQDTSDPDKVPYNLTKDERKAQNLDFTRLAAERIVRVVMGKDVPLENVPWDDLKKNGQYDEHLLSDLPMEYLIQRSISHEAFRFAEDTSGYDSILHTWNAADGLPWNLGDFGKTIKYFHVRNGYDLLPLTLARFFEEAGGKVHLGRRLTGFDQIAPNDPSAGIAMQFKVDGEDAPRSIVARRLILAMPRRSIELLDRTGPVLAAGNTDVHDLIQSVTPIPLFKLAMCYRSPWWQKIPPVRVPPNGGELKSITQGESITDLPIRQCYYWAVDKDTQNAVVLIYDDGRDLDYWAGLRDRKKRKPFQSGQTLSGAATLPPWSSYEAPALMVKEAHRQLLLMHGVENDPDIPEPYAAAYRDWGEDPFGGGANFWNVGARSVDVFRAILQPRPPVPVYICGEAYSNFQGWVEGPLETADQMLALHFGLPSSPPYP
jgi:Flavin containing amine oxidoreductase